MDHRDKVPIQRKPCLKPVKKNMCKWLICITKHFNTWIKNIPQLAHSASEPRSSLVTASMTSPCRVMLIHTYSIAIVFLHKSLNLHKCHPVQCAKWLSPSHYSNCRQREMLPSSDTDQWVPQHCPQMYLCMYIWNPFHELEIFHPWIFIWLMAYCFLTYKDGYGASNATA